MRIPRDVTLLDGALLAVAAVATWQKLSWEVAGRVTLLDLLLALFVALFALDRLLRRDARLAPAAIVALGFALMLAAVHLAGYLGLDTVQATEQWTKGILKWALFAAFLVLAIAHLARRGERLWWRTAGAMIAGVAVSSAYGLVQLATRVATGVELDTLLISPYFSGARRIGANFYGVVSTYDAYGVTGQATVYRLTGLSEDPNHLGVIASVPLLLLTALVIGARTGLVARRRAAAAGVAALLLVAAILTQSRSGLLGLAVGTLMLLLWYRRACLRREVVVPLVLLVVAALAVGLARPQQATELLNSRLSTGDRSSQLHLEFYELAVPILQTSPAFGIGVNNFALYYQFQTGRADFGPHSFYVATLTEMGIAGAVAWGMFLLWTGGRLRLLLRAGRARAALPDDDGRLTAAGRGLAAGLVATLVSNLFYLTMIFGSFYLVLALIIAAPAALGAERLVAARRAPADPRAAPTTLPG
jgi:O-antigen ligase